MSRPPPVAPVSGSLRGVGHHVVTPLLILLSDRVVMFGVGRAHHVELLVLHLEVTVATPLVDVSFVFNSSGLKEHWGAGGRQQRSEAHRGLTGGWRRDTSNGAPTQLTKL